MNRLTRLAFTTPATLLCCLGFLAATSCAPTPNAPTSSTPPSSAPAAQPSSSQPQPSTPAETTASASAPTGLDSGAVQERLDDYIGAQVYGTEKDFLDGVAEVTPKAELPKFAVMMTCSDEGGTQKRVDVDVFQGEEKLTSLGVDCGPIVGTMIPDNFDPAKGKVKLVLKPAEAKNIHLVAFGFEKQYPPPSTPAP